MKNVLFVLTNHQELGNTGQKTGFWIEEFAAPYYHLKDGGIHVSLSTPKGGTAPIDPQSNGIDYQTPATIRFNNDTALQKALTNTTQLKSIIHSDYDAVFFPGGHGPLWDLAENREVVSLIEDFYKHNKIIAAVCHAPIVLKDTKNKAGEPLVKGKKVTAFTNSEETAIGLNTVVPFLVEDELKNNGGIFSKAENWEGYAIEDDLLITGQNPASSILVAQLLSKKLSA